MKTNNPFDVLAIGLCLGATAILLFCGHEPLAVDGRWVLALVPIAASVVLLMFAFGQLWRAVKLACRLLDDAVIAYQLKNYPLKL